MQVHACEAASCPVAGSAAHYPPGPALLSAAVAPSFPECVIPRGMEHCPPARFVILPGLRFAFTNEAAV